MNVPRPNNPFTLSFGKKPKEYISRYEYMTTIVNTFEEEQAVSQAYLIEGIRGCGKTVLMTAIAKELSSKEDWIVVDLNSTQDLLADLADKLSNACRTLPEALRDGFQISFAGFGVGWNGDVTGRSDVGVIDDILSELTRHQKKVLITIDEVMHDKNMRHFASEFQIVIRKDFPIYLVMTGLYEQIYEIQNDPALTFLLRTPKIRMEPLSMLQIMKEYARVFDLEQARAKELAEITKGYAFAFQALGMIYYEYGEKESMEQMLSRLDDLLDDFVYRKIWEGLSERERSIVRSISDRRMRTKDVCDAASMTTAVFSKYRERLMNKGILVSTQYGMVELALPRFSKIVEAY